MIRRRWSSHPSFFILRLQIFAGLLVALLVSNQAIAQVDVLYFYNLANVGQTPPAVTDMCAAINLAWNKYPGLTLDARGFTGMQYCSADHATTMLGNDTNGVKGKLLLGNVTMVIDGPDPNVAAYYQDGNGSTYGTPAIVVPNQYWGIQGLSRSATTITFCTGAGAPISQCQHSFPQRKLTITGVSYLGTSPQVMTVTVSETLTSGANISPGEYVQIVGVPNVSTGLPSLKVQSIPDNHNFKVYVPNGWSAACPCGSAYLMTPVIGFGPGGGAYNPGYGTQQNSFGQHVKDLTIALGSKTLHTVTGYWGAVGVQNVYCEETCGIDDVAVRYVSSIGIEDYSNPSQNFGPMTNVVVSTNGENGFVNTYCDYGTTGIVMADAPDRGINGWTITFNGDCEPQGVATPHKPVTAILMDKPDTAILNGHNENTRDAVLVGSQGAGISGAQLPVAVVKVAGLLGPPNSSAGTNLVHVSNVFTSTNTYSNVFRNLAQQSGSTNAVLDDISGYTCTDQGLAYFETDFTGFPSTDCSAPASGTPNAFILNNASFGIYKGSTTPVASMSATRVKVPSLATTCSSSNDGEICYDSTNKNTHIRANGNDAIAGAFAAASLPGANDCLTAAISAGNIMLGDFTHPCMTLAGDLGNTYAAPQVTATHLASPLPASQGGTGFTNGAATGLCAGATSLSITPASTVYLGLANSSGTESQIALPVPISGTVTAMHVQMSALPTTYSVTFQARNSGGNMLSTCTINTTGNTWCDVTGSQSISEGSGSTWDIQATAGSGAAAVSRNYTVCLKVTLAN